MKELEHWRRTILSHDHRAIGVYPGFQPFVIADLLTQQAETEVSQEPESTET